MRFLSYFLLLSVLLFAESPSVMSMSIQEINKLIASDATEADLFGTSVAISGNTVVIGGPQNDDAGSSSGSVYVFEKDSITGLFYQVAKLLPFDGDAYNQFGYSVAINNNIVFISGGDSIYIYEKPINGWVDANQEDGWTGTQNEVAKLLASDGVTDPFFGVSVAISGNTVVIGVVGDDDLGSKSGSVYIYEKPANGWVNTN